MLPNLQEVDRKVDRLASLYREADLQLQGLVLPVALRAGMARRQQMRVLQQSRALLGALDRRGGPRAAALVQVAYALGARQVDPRFSVAPDNQRAINTLGASLYGRLTAATAGVLRNVSDVLRRMTLVTVSHEMAGVGSPLAGTIGPLSISSLTDRSGRRWGLEQYARMALRSIGTESVTEGTLWAMDEHGYDLVSVTRTDHPSIACSPWDGGTFSLSGKTSDFPVMTKFPPFHGGCQHYIYPAPEEDHAV